MVRVGIGALYLAWDPNLHRQVAIKILIDDNDELRERFSREARSAARLQHSNIVTMYDVGEDDGRPYMTMKYIQGQTLADISGKREPLTTTRKLQLAERLVDGLAFAHKAGIIHRDVKPANIMVDLTGTLKILDFGIAHISESTSLTRVGRGGRDAQLHVTRTVGRSCDRSPQRYFLCWRRVVRAAIVPPGVSGWSRYRCATKASSG